MADPPRYRQSTEGKVIEIITAIVLSIAGLLTTWSSFQSSQWSGYQAAYYSRANAIRIKASTAAIEGEARTMVELNLFNAWLTAAASGNTKLADFYRVRFPPEMRGPFEAWLSTHPLTNSAAPPSPFGSGVLHQRATDAARSLDTQADTTFAQGQHARQIADRFERTTVFFAISLFFGGIAQVFGMQAVRLGLVVVAIASCAFAIFHLVGLPVLRPV
ncbi:MAG TPA: hypothetical protein VHY34_01605 [Caulobacteraceae bacterium]|jgi:hypothetical protein|nr:hypothetical protein [Caulobacteraceae bacterium]